MIERLAAPTRREIAARSGYLGRSMSSAASDMLHRNVLEFDHRFRRLGAFVGRCPPA
jgi:hypothetical protein